jgi:hypothetical protein
MNDSNPRKLIVDYWQRNIIYFMKLQQDGVKLFVALHTQHVTMLSNKELGENLCKLHIIIKNVSYFFRFFIEQGDSVRSLLQIPYWELCNKAKRKLCQYSREKTCWGLISNQFSVFITLLDTQTRL